MRPYLVFTIVSMADFCGYLWCVRVRARCYVAAIAITETWLLPQILNNEIIPAGYQIFRRDRTNGIGGGILLAISNSLPSHSYICSQTSEFLLVQIERKPVVVLILPLKALLLCTMIFLHPFHLSVMKIQYFYLVTLTNLIYHGTLCPRHLLLVLLSATNYSI